MSRRVSPRKLIASTVRLIARVGNITNHGACSIIAGRARSTSAPRTLPAAGRPAPEAQSSLPEDGRTQLHRHHDDQGSGDIGQDMAQEQGDTSWPPRPWRPRFHQQIDQDHHQGDQQDTALKLCVVGIEQGVDGQTSDAGEGKDGLD